MSENEDNKKPSTTNPQSTKPEPPRERGVGLSLNLLILKMISENLKMVNH